MCRIYTSTMYAVREQVWMSVFWDVQKCLIANSRSIYMDDILVWSLWECIYMSEEDKRFSFKNSSTNTPAIVVLYTHSLDKMSLPYNFRRDVYMFLPWMWLFGLCIYLLLLCTCQSSTPFLHWLSVLHNPSVVLLLYFAKIIKEKHPCTIYWSSWCHKIYNRATEKHYLIGNAIFKI